MPKRHNHLETTRKSSSILHINHHIVILLCVCTIKLLIKQAKCKPTSSFKLIFVLCFKTFIIHAFLTITTSHPTYYKSSQEVNFVKFKINLKKTHNTYKKLVVYIVIMCTRKSTSSQPSCKIVKQ